RGYFPRRQEDQGRSPAAPRAGERNRLRVRQHGPRQPLPPAPPHHGSSGEEPLQPLRRVGRAAEEEHDVGLGSFSVLSSQFSVLSSQFSVLSSQFSVLSSQFSVLSSQKCERARFLRVAW